jgi:hypothetical protein
MMTWLNPSEGYVFRITHRNNLKWILDHGLHCPTSEIRDPDFVTIGSREIIDRRNTHPVPIDPGGVLTDYVPFYFTPCSLMLYNIVTGYNVEKVERTDIVFLVSSVKHLRNCSVEFVFTDRHALVIYSRFYGPEDDLSVIDWGLLQRRDFSRDPEDPEKLERYQAELLVHRHVPIDAVTGIACYNEEVLNGIAELVGDAGVNVPVRVGKGWFF